MACARWLWDQSSADVKEHDFVPYPDEISKILEESYLLMGLLMTCDVGKGRVVRMSQRGHGLVQLVKEDPGLWRAVKREVLYPDAIHVTTAARPAPPASSLPPAAPAPARTPLSTSSLLETLRLASSTGVSFSAGGPSATMPLATSLHRPEAAFSSAAEPPVREVYPIFHQRAVTPPPALRAAGMPEPRSASPPARTGKKRDGDECSDLEELQPPPAKLPAVRARPVAKQNADGSWPCMSSRVWGPRTVFSQGVQAHAAANGAPRTGLLKLTAPPPLPARAMPHRSHQPSNHPPRSRPRSPNSKLEKVQTHKSPDTRPVRGVRRRLRGVRRRLRRQGRLGRGHRQSANDEGHVEIARAEPGPGAAAGVVPWAIVKAVAPGIFGPCASVAAAEGLRASARATPCSGSFC